MIDISKWAFENKKLIYFLIAVLIVGGVIGLILENGHMRKIK